MRNVLAILMVSWVFVGSPAMCLAGVVGHSCKGEVNHCSMCESEPCESQPSESEQSNSPHGCPVDPCRTDVCRLEQDELTESDRLADMVQSIAGVLPGSALVGATLADVTTARFGLAGIGPPALTADTYAATGLPLLI